MTLVLDAGALIAIDRGDQRIIGKVNTAVINTTEVVTVAPVVGQAWRGGPKQARLARALRTIRVLAVDIEEAMWSPSEVVT